tara:strand:+ start:1064 stop:1204 length:141 start_codon:yes stop_codon:yes gene_type:complete
MKYKVVAIKANDWSALRSAFRPHPHEKHVAYMARLIKTINKRGLAP